MADNNNLEEENSFELDPNLLIRHSYSYTNYQFYNRCIDTQNNPINRKYIGQFILGEKIGQGTFGIVVLGTHRLTKEKVAVKILDKHKILQETDKSRLEREIKIIKKMRHNNIVHLYDVKETPTSLYIIMEYINGKELFEYIISNKKLSELESCKFYQQIISGIEYLGKIKVVHRDIKPENLLLDNKNNIKIVDFGLSNSYPKNELLTTACGSPCYAAPEMINGEKYYGLKADIWSSGIVLYAMLCGYLPFEESDNEKLYKKITAGKFKTPNFLSESAKDFLHRVLDVDPKSRITIPQMKKHPWFNQINPKLNMSEGLLLNKVIVPIDENIVSKMVNEYKFNGEEVRTNLLLNNHNHITTTYFLILNQKLRNGEKTIGNMKSKEFLKYIHNPINLLSHYGNNMKKIIQLRAKNIDNKIINEEKDIKNKRNKNSTKNLSTRMQSGSTGKMNVGSSIEKINKKEKREISVQQRRNTKLTREKSKKRNKSKNKNDAQSVDTKIKKINEIREKIKERKNKKSATPDTKIKQTKTHNLNKNINLNVKGLEMNKNQKRNTVKNKKVLITELKSEEKENSKKNKYILEEIEELKDVTNLDSNNYNNDSEIKENNPNIPNIKRINKLNKKAITNKNVINNKKNKLNISLIEKKENDKKRKIRRLVEKKNVTEKRMQIKSYNISNQNALNNTEIEKDQLIVNTDISKYVKLSKLMRRMKGNKNKSYLNRKKNSLDEDSSIKVQQLNKTEREDILFKNKEIEKEKENEVLTDRFEEEEIKDKVENLEEKSNIIANLYDYNAQFDMKNIRNRRKTEKIVKKKNKKFIDTSVSFDKTNDEIDKFNQKILIADENNHIEENYDSELDSSEYNNKDKNYETKTNDKENNYNEEEELKKKEKDIKYLKLKSKHKAFNVVKKPEEKFHNNLKNTYKSKKHVKNNDYNILIRSFKKTKTKNYNTHYLHSIMRKNNKLKNNIIDKEVKILETQRSSKENNKRINHHTTVNNYHKLLNNSKKKYLTKKFDNIEEHNANKNRESNNSLNNEIYNVLERNSNSNSKHKNRIKKVNLKYKNNELNNINGGYKMNNDIKIFDLNSINYCKNNIDIKELKEKMKKELDNKKVKYNLTKNKFRCNKNDNKFEIEIYPLNESKNIYIIKYIKKFGNVAIIKDINKLILSKFNFC